jgi:hypothetical protein
MVEDGGTEGGKQMLWVVKTPKSNTEYEENTKEQIPILTRK